MVSMSLPFNHLPYFRQYFSLKKQLFSTIFSIGDHLPTPPALPPALQRFEDAKRGELSRGVASAAVLDTRQSREFEEIRQNREFAEFLQPMLIEFGPKSPKRSTRGFYPYYYQWIIRLLKGIRSQKCPILNFLLDQKFHAKFDKNKIFLLESAWKTIEINKIKDFKTKMKVQT